MALGDLIGQVNQNGLYQGGMNYLGNNTGFGQGINGLYGGLTGNPNQLIGAAPGDPNNPTQPSMQDAIKAHAANAMQLGNVQPFNTPPPNQPPSDPNAGFLKPIGGSGNGQALAALGALFL